ncbi:hypothetical protein [Streptacidiphilus monticola]|uniref:Uncharacterized protein n=1 Tax=Streptacidiphilus monticola TaxID=2161674 RepID=A0ABW1G2P2_9ACTN
MSDIDNYLLVLPGRDEAEAVADELAERYPGLTPELHREALAGEDDAEDAQWLVVLPAPLPQPLGTAELESLAAEHDGWLEED